MSLDSTSRVMVLPVRVFTKLRGVREVFLWGEYISLGGEKKKRSGSGRHWLRSGEREQAEGAYICTVDGEQSQCMCLRGRYIGVVLTGCDIALYANRYRNVFFGD